MTLYATASAATMVCEGAEKASMSWLIFLAGISVGCIVTLTAIRLKARRSAIKPFPRRDDEERERFRSSFASTADNTSVSMDVSDTDRELSTGFDINVTTRVLDALRDHLQNVDTEEEINCLGKLRISYEPGTNAADGQMEVSSMLRRWSVSSESISANSESPRRLRYQGEVTPVTPKHKSCCCGDARSHQRQSRRSHSFAGRINSNHCIEEEDRALEHFRKNFDEPLGEVKIEVVSEEGWFADDADIIQAREFDERVLSRICSLEESQMYLRKQRAVSLLSSRLMAAPDEQSCYEIVSRLLVPLFHVDRCSYVLMKDADNMIVKQITVNKREHMVMGVDKGFIGGGRWVDGGFVKPLKGTAVEVCSKTLKPYYCPNIKESPFETQRQIGTMGLNTILAAPILVNGNKFIGCIMICMVQVDAFAEYDQILIQDIAKKLGVNIYSKRMKHAAEMSNKISREMLHSMIPPYVIEKISCFWDESSDEYQRRRSSVISSSKERLRRFSGTSSSDADTNKGKIHLLSKMYNQEEGEEIGTLVETNNPDFPLSTTTKALYAENVNNVCIIFADIVGFSRISLELEPFVVVNMLQDLFFRFDELCDKHNIQKLETIGDAYICTAGIDRDSSKGRESVKDSAVRILAMAKEMVRQARHVLVPTPDVLLGRNSKLFDTLEIRVGIHVGNVTCGVLGQRLPKMTVFGNAVNLAARMEQTSLPSHIRITQDFYDLVADVENQWDKCEEIEMKNMGTMVTYLLDPLKTLHLIST